MTAGPEAALQRENSGKRFLFPHDISYRREVLLSCLLLNEITLNLLQINLWRGQTPQKLILGRNRWFQK
jgi:hypothetical protein